MDKTNFAVYSLTDVITVINHKDVGKCVLSDVGGGRITVSYSGDLASMTTTATGYVVINKLVAKNGQIGLEIPTNSLADIYMRKFIKTLDKSQTNRFAIGTLTLTDPAANRKLTFTGVVPQKRPDEGYDATSSNRQYNLLFAEMVESTAS